AIIFEGYETTPGDSPSIPFSQNLVMSASEMPLINTGSTSGNGFSYNSKSYIIVKNIQVSGYDQCFVLDNCEYVKLINCYAEEGNDNITSFTNSTGINQSVIDCYSSNGRGYGFHLAGRGHLIKGCFASSSYAVGMDYSFDITGSNITDSGQHIVIDNEIVHFVNDSHHGHGVSVYGRKPNQYNLVENMVMTDIQQCIEARRSGTGYSVFRNIEVKSTTFTEQVAVMIGSAHHCIYDNIRMDNGRAAIKFY
ncbi:unnamed protein product, partial [marine sediment metagenome]